MDKQDLTLERIYNRLEELAPLGQKAVLRRALAIVAAEMGPRPNEESFRRCHEPGTDKGLEDFRYNEDGTLPYTSLVREVRSEDRRKTVFADPDEALAAYLLDFYSGRLDALEVRLTPALRSSLEAAHDRALEILRASTPLISIMAVAAPSRDGILNALRSLVRILETGSEDSPQPAAIPMLLREEDCRVIGVEAGEPRWTKNGKVLQQPFRQVFRCIDEDACCSNATYTKHGTWEWRDVWADGNPANSPPMLPDPFVPYPWDNRCRVFPSLVTAMVSSDWGWRRLDDKPDPDFHSGIDLAVQVGTQVLSAEAGTIIRIDSTSPNGMTYIVVQSGSDFLQYLHVTPSSSLQEGQPIAAGSVLGLTAPYKHPHLHFARFRPPTGTWTGPADGYSVDPCPE